MFLNQRKYNTEFNKSTLQSFSKGTQFQIEHFLALKTFKPIYYQISTLKFVSVIIFTLTIRMRFSLNQKFYYQIKRKKCQILK